MGLAGLPWGPQPGGGELELLLLARGGWAARRGAAGRHAGDRPRGEAHRGHARVQGPPGGRRAARGGVAGRPALHEPARARVQPRARARKGHGPHRELLRGAAAAGGAAALRHGVPGPLTAARRRPGGRPRVPVGRHRRGRQGAERRRHSRRAGGRANGSCAGRARRPARRGGADGVGPHQLGGGAREAEGHPGQRRGAGGHRVGAVRGGAGGRRS